MMLGFLVPLLWRQDSSSRFHTGKPQAPLPPELAELSRSPLLARTKTERTCPCCGGRALPLSVGLTDTAVGAVFVQSPLLYCTGTERFVLTASQAEEFRHRQRRLRDDEAASLPPADPGAAPGEPPLASTLQQLLAGSRELRYHAPARAWTVHPLPSRPPAGVPDGVCFHSGAFPGQITLKLEPGTRCNFTCGFCYGRHLEQGNLSWDAFLSLLGRVPGVRFVELTGEGEPLANKQIFRMVAECRRRGLGVHVTTNGSLLTDRSAERLLSSGATSVAVSLESVDEERFAQLRTGGSLPQVIEGIRALVRARERLGVSATLSLWVTLLRETLPELEALGEMVDRLGIDHLEFQVLNTMDAYARFYDARLRANALEPGLVDALARQAVVHPKVRAALAAAGASYGGRECDVFLQTAMVSWQGAVTPCCLLKAPDFPQMGNLHESTFEEIWESPRFRLFRFSLQHGIVLESCAGCARVAAA